MSPIDQIPSAEPTTRPDAAPATEPTPAPTSPPPSEPTPAVEPTPTTDADEPDGVAVPPPAAGEVNPKQLVCPRCGGSGIAKWADKNTGRPKFGVCYQCKGVDQAPKGYQDANDLFANRMYTSKDGKSIRWKLCIRRVGANPDQRKFEAGFGPASTIFKKSGDGYTAIPVEQVKAGDIIVAPSRSKTKLLEVLVEDVQDVAMEPA